MRLNSFKASGLLYIKTGCAVSDLSWAVGALTRNINDNEAKSALNIVIFSYGGLINHNK